MSFLVTNCFHWVGFHIVNYLLEQGHRVDGFDDLTSSKKENLSMFFGRNDLFSLNPDEHQKEKATYEAAILVDVFKNDDNFESKRTLRLCHNTLNHEIDTDIVMVKLPLLFGEWMQMSEEGAYHDNQFVRFDSDYFLTEAIYIDDFIKCIMQSIKSTYLPSFFEVKSSEKKEKKDVTLDKSIYIRDNKPIKENLQTVLTHFKKYRTLY